MAKITLQGRLASFLNNVIDELETGRLAPIFRGKESRHLKNLRKEQEKLQKKINPTERDLLQTARAIEEILKKIEEIEEDRTLRTGAARERITGLEREIAEIQAEADRAKRQIRINYHIRSEEEQRDSNIVGWVTLGFSKLVEGIFTNEISPGRARYLDGEIDKNAAQRVKPILGKIEKETPAFEKRKRKIDEHADKKLKKPQKEVRNIEAKKWRKESILHRLQRGLDMNTVNINVNEELEKYARANGTTIDKMVHHLGADFTTLTNFGKELEDRHPFQSDNPFTLYRLEKLCSWQGKIKGNRSLNNEERALKQFFNHVVIPHFDFFLIHAVKRTDLKRISNDDFPAINRLGKQPLLDEGIATFQAAGGDEKLSQEERKKISAEVATETAEPDLAFVGNAQYGSVHNRYIEAVHRVKQKTDEFEALFRNTIEAIEKILNEKEDKIKKKEEQKSATDKARQRNIELESDIKAIEKKKEDTSKIHGARVGKLKEEGYGTAFIQGYVGAGALAIFDGGASLIITGLFTAITTKNKASSLQAATDAELGLLSDQIHNLKSQLANIPGMEAKLELIEKELVKLLKDQKFKESYGTAQKKEAIRKAYIAKSVLDFGGRNLEALEQVCRTNGFANVDALIKNLDPRLGEAVNNSCFGYADSNDLCVIIAEANGISGQNTTAAQRVLKTYAEEHVKPNIGAHYSQASVVDQLYHANVLGLGTKLYAARLMVQRETDDAIRAIEDYQIATNAALADPNFSSRGVRDVRRLFDYYMERHGGEGILTDAKINDGSREVRYSSKKVVAQTSMEQRRYVETVKHTHAAGNPAVPPVEEDFLKLCAYEYLLPQQPHEAARGHFLNSYNPHTAATFPMVSATINHFISRFSMSSLNEYRNHIGESLDGLIAQTFMDYFNELGRLHSGDAKILGSRVKLAESHKLPNVFPMDYENHLKLITNDSASHFNLFLEIYAKNLEKMMSSAREETRQQLTAEIRKVHNITGGKLSPPILAPESPEARRRARDENHTFENTHWRGGIG